LFSLTFARSSMPSDADLARQMQQEELSRAGGPQVGTPVGTPIQGVGTQGSVPMAQGVPTAGAPGVAQPAQQFSMQGTYARPVGQVQYPVQPVVYATQQPGQGAGAPSVPGGVGAQYFVPAGPFGLGQAEPMSQRELVLLHVHQLSRSVRCFTMIDLIFGLMSVAKFGPIGLFIALLPAAGYYGAATYQPSWVLTYVVFLFLKTMMYIFDAMHPRGDADGSSGAADGDGDDDERARNGSGFFLLLLVMLNIWISHYVLRLHALLRQLPQEDIENLRAIERGEGEVRQIRV